MILAPGSGPGLKTNLTQQSLTTVSVELVRSHIPLVYTLACLLAFLLFGLAYFIIFKWVAKVLRNISSRKNKT